jgi:GNAT superfamily N-acetyltransferase
VNLRRALAEEAGQLSEIALQAKSQWGYPENWIEHWKADLTITPEFITANEVFVAAEGNNILGFCALALREDKAELEHMWVKPEHMGTGVGRKLLIHAKERARALSARSLEISADPNAAGFYEHLGARQIGTVESEIEGKPRVLPRLSLDLASVHKKQPPGW